MANLWVASATAATCAQPPGILAQNHEKAQHGAQNVEAHLHHVGPDHRRHPAFEGVEESQQSDQHNALGVIGAEHDGDHQRHGEDP